MDEIKSSATDKRMADPVVRQPKERWFVHHMHDAEDGWQGPHATIDAALKEGVDWWPDTDRLYVAKGRRSTKAEREDTGCDYRWHVDIQHALEIYLPPNPPSLPRSDGETGHV